MIQEAQVCTDCGAPATCAYDWGMGPRLACAAHDPLQPLFQSAGRVPQAYRTLVLGTAVSATTGHLGVRWP